MGLRGGSGEDRTYTVTTNQYGRLVSVTRRDSSGAQVGQTTYGYDSHGRQYTATDARNGTTTSYFNKADQVSGIVTPVPASGLSAQVTTNFFDNLGRVMATKLPDNTYVTNKFGLSGLLTNTFGSRTYPVAYTYDAQGRMKTMKTWTNFTSNLGAATTTWNYNAYRGWLDNKRYPDNTGPSYTYTPAGRLQTRLWARGANTTYSYNNAGDLSAVTYSDSTPALSYGYDRRGRQSAITQGSATTTRLYDDASDLLSESYAGGSLNGLIVTNRYDQYLRRTNLSLFNGSTLLTRSTNSYDSASRLAKVSDGTNSAAYSYLANSPLVSQIAFTNNGVQRMVTTKQFDLLNRLTNSSSSVSFVYAYNSANQRTRATLADGSYWVYAYDSLGQVISGRKYWSDGTAVAGQQFEYTFDDIGNRKTAGSGGDHDQYGGALHYASYWANSLNQYTSRDVTGYVNVIGSAKTNATVSLWTADGYWAQTSRKASYFRGELPLNNTTGALWLTITNLAVLNNGTNADIATNTVGNAFVRRTPETFGYDADGNLTADGRFTITWDAENRSLSFASLISGPSGSKIKVDCAYDWLGRRTQKIVSTWNGSAFVPQSTNRFVYDGWNVIAVLNPQLAVVQSFTWGLDLSGSLQGAGGVGGLLCVNAGSNGVHFVAMDGNGNVAALVKASDGTVSATYEYGPFGEVLRATGPMAKTNPFRFSTKYQDDETDLLYYGYRYYNPSTGRWLSRDPLEEAGGENLYIFCGNDPIRNWDLFGERWKVDRNGGQKASAQPEGGDTVADLANLIGLSYSEYERWLTPVGGTTMPKFWGQPLTGCEQFEIPNTVVAYWAGNLGWFGRWYVRWNSSIRYLRSRGFNVDERYHQKGDTWALQKVFILESQAKELHGVYFWGHGSAPYPAEYLVSDTGDAVLAFSSPGLYYKMALGLVFSCDSNRGESSLMSGMGSQIWLGFNGTLVPWPYPRYHARHYIKPGQQETH